MTDSVLAMNKSAVDEPATASILGVSISAVNLHRATSIILGWIAARQRNFVTVTGVHGVMEAQEDAAFKDILNSSNLCVPDGMPLAWLARLQGFHDAGRVFGPDLMLRVTEKLAENGHSAFYYGGAPGVAAELAETMERAFPGVRTAGVYCPPFRALTPAESADIARQINASNADIVWVGLSTPKQERWMSEFRERLTVPVLMGVGAAFDYNTGRLSRAPRWVQACALEWLYRLIQEPRRLWRRYLRNNPLFLWYLLYQYTRIKSF